MNPEIQFQQLRSSLSQEFRCHSDARSTRSAAQKQTVCMKAAGKRVVNYFNSAHFRLCPSVVGGMITPRAGEGKFELGVGCWSNLKQQNQQ